MVYVNVKGGGRKLVSAELVKENHARITVKLPDGNIITRRKSRDLPKEGDKDGTLQQGS